MQDTIHQNLLPLATPEHFTLAQGQAVHLCLWGLNIQGERGVLTSASGHALYAGDPDDQAQAEGYLDNYSRADGPMQGTHAESGLCTLDASGRILTVQVHYRDEALLARSPVNTPASLTHLRPATEALLAATVRSIFPLALSVELQPDMSVIHTPSGAVATRDLAQDHRSTLEGLSCALLALGARPGEHLNCQEARDELRA